VIESIKRTRVGLKGPITTPVGKGVRSANVALRKKLDLYANLRPAKTYPGLRSRYEHIDMIIVRENTEDLYAGVEFQKVRLNSKKSLRPLLALPEPVLMITPRSVSNIFLWWQHAASSNLLLTMPGRMDAVRSLRYTKPT